MRTLAGQLLVIAFFSYVLSACTTNKKVVYFQDVPEDLHGKWVNFPLAQFEDPVIQPNDLMYISIQTLDPEVNPVISNANVATFPVAAGNSGTVNVPGYLVDKDGIVELSLVGKIKIAGLTTQQARDAIRAKASLYYKTPVVNIRFANFTVTVLGEVARPSTYVVSNEKIDVLQALGMAGDLTIYGQRDNVLVIREENGVKKATRVNLLNVKAFDAPFYLKQGDIVYVAPTKTKVASTDTRQIRNITIITSVLSLVIIIASRINFQ